MTSQLESLLSVHRGIREGEAQKAAQQQKQIQEFTEARSIDKLLALFQDQFPADLTDAILGLGVTTGIKGIRAASDPEAFLQWIHQGITFTLADDFFGCWRLHGTSDDLKAILEEFGSLDEERDPLSDSERSSLSISIDGEARAFSNEERGLRLTAAIDRITEEFPSILAHARLALENVKLGAELHAQAIEAEGSGDGPSTFSHRCDLLSITAAPPGWTACWSDPENKGETIRLEVACWALVNYTPIEGEPERRVLPMVTSGDRRGLTFATDANNFLYIEDPTRPPTRA